MNCLFESSVYEDFGKIGSGYVNPGSGGCGGWGRPAAGGRHCQQSPQPRSFAGQGRGAGLDYG